MLDAQSPFNLAQKHADAINAILPTCKYVVGIRENGTGEVRFCPEDIEWDGESSLSWWNRGNMSCDCNRHLIFNRHSDESWDEDIPCGETRYTVVGIWFPDGSDIRDLDALNDFPWTRPTLTGSGDERCI